MSIQVAVGNLPAPDRGAGAAEQGSVAIARRCAPVVEGPYLTEVSSVLRSLRFGFFDPKWSERQHDLAEHLSVQLRP